MTSVAKEVPTASGGLSEDCDTEELGSFFKDAHVSQV